MTSLAFILGVAPLVVATGAGAEMRQSLGTAVFGGMLGVTGFGLLFTPAFYTLVRRMRLGGRQAYEVAREGPEASAGQPNVVHL
jgi:HAE1 family hydrophobic/amphiphilic exporter-1